MLALWQATWLFTEIWNLPDLFQTARVPGRNSRGYKGKLVGGLKMIDPVADMIIRLKNASMVFKPYVDVPWSKFKEKILDVLKEERYIKDWEVVGENNQRKVLRVHLLYYGKRPAILKVRRESKPGRRLYISAEQLAKRKQDTGIAVLTTSRGVMSNRKARNLNVGGEILFYIW